MYTKFLRMIMKFKANMKGHCEPSSTNDGCGHCM